MRTMIKKIMVILFLALMLINNSLLMLIANAVDEIQSIVDESKANTLIDVNLEKYVNYSLDDNNKGLLMQLNIKSGIEYIDGQEYIPIKASGMSLKFPKINDRFPETIEIIDISTKATNGSDDARDWQHNYNSENGELKIVAVNNEDDNGNIYSENVENARDEYRVIAYYDEQCYSESVDKSNIKFIGKVQAKLADNEATLISNEFEKEFEVEDNVSGLISTSVQTSDIYNGFISSNKMNGTDYRTQYSENMKVNISYKNISDEVIINARDAFVDTRDNVQDTNEIVYKSTKISKQNVLDILGENGTLKILNTSGDILKEINKDTETSDEGFIEVTYQDELSEIVINMSKPINLGTLNFDSTKEIKETMINMNNNRIVSNHIIHACNNVDIKDEETDEVVRTDKVATYEFENNNFVDIKNSETRVDVSVDKTNWTNSIQNDVIFTATLVSNEPKYTLFKNPVIEIELPEEVDRVILNDEALLYENNFSLSNAEIIENGNRKVLKISINGIQNQYILNSVTDGIHIVMPATIIMKKDIVSIDTKVKYRYSNQNTVVTDYENAGNTCKDIDINIKSIIQNSEQAVVFENEDNSNFEQIDNMISTEVITQVGKDILEDNAIVYQGEVINYIVRLKNESNQTINNVKAVCEIPEGTTVVTKNPFYSDIPLEGEEGYETNELYKRHEDITNVEIKKDSLNSGEIYEEKFLILVDDLDNEITEKNVVINTKFYIDDNQVNIKEKNLIYKPAELSAHLYPADKQYFADNSYRWRLKINNLTNKNLNNVIVKVYLDKEIELDYENLKERYDKVNYDENTGELQIILNSIEAKKENTIVIPVSINKFEKGKYEYTSKLYSEVSTDDKIKYRADIESVKTKRPYVTILQTSEKEGKELRAGEKVEYNFTVSNPSSKDTHIKVVDNLPKGINPVSAIYECYELQENSEFKRINKEKDISSKVSVDGIVQSDFELETYLPAGETIDIKIIGEAAEILATLEAVNVATISGNEIFSEVSNSIKNKVLYYGYDEENDNPENPTNPDKPSTPDNPNEPINPDKPDKPSSDKKYQISGVAWIDEDKDGRRTDNEKILEGITVKLFDIETNKIVVDYNDNSMIVKTDKNGYYNFKDIKVGKYIVLFEFDTDKYKLTTYHKTSISETVNSDAILKEVNIDGKISNVGVTDTIDLYKDYSNIDIGLIRNDEFDLKLDKYITKITVSNYGKDKSYDYTDSKLAKVEIPAKELSTSVVFVEYKIVVTNEGNTSGYVKQIWDYLPNDLKFDPAYNDDWHKSTNNYLINATLANKKLDPGESQEVTLVLTAQNVTKSIINSAEIGETYNANELNDIDSKEGNKNPKEDDYSEAQIIISIKTGIFVSILKIILMIAIITILVFIIIKFKNKNFLKLFMICILVCGMITLNNISEAVQYVLISYSDLGMHIKDGVWEKVHSNGFYWCISPGDHLCGRDHRYKVTKTQYAWTPSDLAKIHTAQGVPLDQIYDFGPFGAGMVTPLMMEKTESPNDFSVKSNRLENKILVGPYSFRISPNDEKNSKPSYTILDEGNNNITSECEIVSVDGSRKEIKNGESFYLLVPYRVKKVQLKISATRTTSVKRYGYKIITYEMDYSGIQDGYCIGNGSEPQDFISVEPVERTENYEDSKEITWTTKIPKGKIIIEKKDVDRFDEGRLGQELKNTWVEIKGDPSNNKIKEYNTITIMQGNKIEIELIPGKYTIKEVGAPTKYSLKLQQDKFALDNYGVVIEGQKTIREGQKETLTLKNKQYANLRITKKDDWTFNRLEGVEFYITLDGKYISNTFVNGSQDKPAQVQFTTDINNAYIFKTDNSGTITILNLPRYSKDYAVVERGFSEYLDRYYKVDQTPHYPVLKNNEGSITGNWSDLEILNKQEYIDISGLVWEDINMENKISTNNNLYKNGDADVNDKPIVGIPVELKKDGVTIDSLVTDSNGEYKFESKRTGTHGYREILVDEISRYSVEFTYNGLKYKSVATYNDLKNRTPQPSEPECIITSSKAAENQDLRNNINTNFTKIDKGQTGTGIGLNYDTSLDYTASLISKIYHTVDTANGWVTPQDAVRVTAGTKTANYNYELQRVKEHQYEVKHINLGITLREQTDLAITSDIQEVRFTINGFEHTYNYAKRASFITNDQKESYNGYEVGDDELFDPLDAFSVQVKNGRKIGDNGEEYRRSYVRKVYPSYIAHAIDDNVDSNDKLKIYVKYKIVIDNQSSSLKGVINNLRNYHDSNYEFYKFSIYNNDTGLAEEQSGKVNDNGRQCDINLSEIDITSKENLIIYLEYQLKDNVITGDLANSNGIYETEKNLTEITSYSTKDSDGNNYGSIDRDSAPDNVNMNSEQTWEDDTDNAPGFTIKRDDVEKILKGTVFEDRYRPDADGNTEPNNPKEALGNGNYEDGENFVNGAKVRLVDATKDAPNNFVTLYRINNGDLDTKRAENFSIDNDGNYEFVGLVPGVYYIEYEYGTYENRKTVIVGSNKAVTTEEYKSTVVTNDMLNGLIKSQIEGQGRWKGVNIDDTKTNSEIGYWYLDKYETSNYSSAIDDYVQRKNINQALENINYAKKTGYEEKSPTLGDIYLMTSRTPYLSIAIENDKSETDGTMEDNDIEYQSTYQSTYETKFGIVVRPRQKFEIIKEISYVKLTLANGQVLLEGDPRSGPISPYLTYPDGGLLKIEVDNEIIQGATLEITYVMSATNLSALNYDNKEYYLYGTDKSNPVNSRIKLIDYLDKELTKIEPDNQSTTWTWEAKTKTDMREQLSNDTINNSGDYNFFIPSDGYKEIEIAPGVKKDIASIIASKLLSSSEDMIFDNIVEIYNLHNPVGRFYDGTPGNYNFDPDNPNFEEDNNEEPKRAIVTVVPPTGTKEIIIYSLVGVGCLLILAGGIIFIKRKVL